MVKSTSSSDTIDALCLIFARQGLPDQLVSSFTSFEFALFLNRNSIKHLTSPPYSPSNRLAERSVRVIKDLLKKSPRDLSFRHRLGKVLLQYRSIPHSITQIAPSMALNKRKLVTLRNKINPLFCAKETQSATKIPQIDVGSSVLALNMREGEK